MSLSPYFYCLFFGGMEGCVRRFVEGLSQEIPLKRNWEGTTRPTSCSHRNVGNGFPGLKSRPVRRARPWKRRRRKRSSFFISPLSIFLSFTSSNLTLHHNTVRRGGIWSAVGRSVFLFPERGETPLVFRLLYSPPHPTYLPLHVATAALRHGCIFPGAAGEEWEGAGEPSSSFSRLPPILLGAQ